MPTESNQIFPERLRQIMKDTKTTQKQLATAIGMKPQSISQYATGQSLPDLYRLIDIADYFDISSDWLLGRTNDREREPSTVDELGLSESTVSILKQLFCCSDPLKNAQSVFKNSFETFVQQTDIFKNFLSWSFCLSMISHSSSNNNSRPQNRTAKPFTNSILDEMMDEKSQCKCFLSGIIAGYCEIIQRQAESGHPMYYLDEDDKKGAPHDD